MAAEETTIKDYFKHFNKPLSKLAHPTAFAVMSSKETQEVLRGSFFNLGMVMSDCALTSLNQAATRIITSPEWIASVDKAAD